MAHRAPRRARLAQKTSNRVILGGCALSPRQIVEPALLAVRKLSLSADGLLVILPKRVQTFQEESPHAGKPFHCWGHERTGAASIQSSVQKYCSPCRQTPVQRFAIISAVTGQANHRVAVMNSFGTVIPRNFVLTSYSCRGGQAQVRGVN
jgi:hypothetical protein